MRQKDIPWARQSLCFVLRTAARKGTPFWRHFYCIIAMAYTISTTRQLNSITQNMQKIARLMLTRTLRAPARNESIRSNISCGTLRGFETANLRDRNHAGPSRRSAQCRPRAATPSEWRLCARRADPCPPSATRAGLFPEVFQRDLDAFVVHLLVLGLRLLGTLRAAMEELDHVCNRSGWPLLIERPRSSSSIRRRRARRGRSRPCSSTGPRCRPHAKVPCGCEASPRDYRPAAMCS